MAAVVSQLCVRQGNTLLDCFIQHKGCKVEQISPLFHLYLYLFFKFRRAPFCANLACQVRYRYPHEYGSRVMVKEEKSTFQISSLLLSSFISNIYTPETGYYWQNQPKSLKVKRYQEVNSNVKQLAALRNNSVHLNRAGVIEINVCERQGR